MNPFDVRFLNAKDVRLSRAHADDPTVRMVLEGERCWREVQIARAFPFSDPDHYIGFSDGAENDIGLLMDLYDLESESKTIVTEELERRYFTPKVQKVMSVREEHSVVTWDVQTDRGDRHFIVRNIRDNTYSLGPNRVLMTDAEGNRYEFPDVTAYGAKAYQVLAKVL